MTRLEKILVVLIIAWLAEAMSPLVLQLELMRGILPGLAGLAESKTFSEWLRVYTVARGLLACLVNVVCGCWLYTAARCDDERKWLWGVVGLVGGISGVMIYYLVLILKEVRRMNPPSEAPAVPSARRPPPAPSPAPGAPSL